jgi:hypothetical protein
MAAHPSTNSYLVGCNTGRLAGEGGHFYFGPVLKKAGASAMLH